MFILFNKTLEECRQLGARGGRVHARNLRRYPRPAHPRPLAQLPTPSSETVHQASLRLDAQFPWLAAAFTPTRSFRRRIPRQRVTVAITLGART